MQNNPVVSVIIPIFNTEKFLRRAIESILCQTLSDWELILIDDGSTDSSSDICDEYAMKDSRIYVFHRSNHGLSATHEFAVQHAKGKYIQFVDSDDWIEPYMFEKMVVKAEKNDADIVGCNFVSEFNDHQEEHFFTYDSKDDFLHKVVSNQWGVVWKHLFRSCLIKENDFHFPVGINNGEDYYSVVSLIIFAKKVCFVDEILYHYNCANPYSMIRTLNEKKVIEQIKSTILVEELLVNNGLFNDCKPELDERKYLAKAPLLQLDKIKWLFTFPESNYKKTKYPVSKKYIPLFILGHIFSLKRFLRFIGHNKEFFFLYI